MISIINPIKKIILIIISSLLLIFCFTEVHPSSNKNKQIENHIVYQYRLLGNKAYENGLYNIALNYYEQYLNNTKGDLADLSEAYFALIATSLKNNKNEKAYEFLNKLKEKVDSKYSKLSFNKSRIYFWEGCIKLQNSQYKKAEQKFKKALNYKNCAHKEKTLNNLGICLKHQEKWEKAKNVFNKLKNISKSDSQKNNAIKQLIIIELNLGNIKNTEKLVKKLKSNTDRYKALIKVNDLNSKDKIKKAFELYKKTIKRFNKPDVLAYFVSLKLCKSLLSEKRLTKAEKITENTVALAASKAQKEQSLLLRIKVLKEQNNIDKIIDTTKLYLSYFPDSQDKNKLLLKIVNSFRQEENFKKLYKLLSEKFSTETLYTTTAGRLAFSIGKISLSLQKYQDAKKYFKFLLDKGKKQNIKGKASYWLAKTYFLEKEYEKAENILNKIPQKYPKYKNKSLFKIAQIYFKNKNYSGTIKKLKQFKKAHENTFPEPKQLFLYASALQKNGKNNQAAKNFEKFATTFPDAKEAPRASFNAANLQFFLHNYPKAIKNYLKIINKYSNSSFTIKAYYRLLYSYNFLGENKKAVKTALKMLKKYPRKNFTFHAIFWLVNHYKNKPTKSLKYIDKILKNADKNKNITSKALFKKAYILNQNKEYNNALKIINKLEENYNKTKITPKVFFLKGNIYSTQGKYRKAKDAYEEVIKFTPSKKLSIAAKGRIADTLFALIHFSRNEERFLEKAIKQYKEILEINDISPFIKIQTLYKLAKCYEISGNNKKAIFRYHETIYKAILSGTANVNPNKEWVAKAATSLARLLKQKDTVEAAEAAISIYKTLIRLKIEPVSLFKKKINSLNKKYKLKE